MYNPKIAAFDVDGVILKFLPGFERTASQVLGRPVIRLNMAWDLAVAYGLTAEEHAAVWAGIASLHTYRDLPPEPGALEALAMMQDAGYEVHAVTAIQPQFVLDRETNLLNLGFSPKAIHAVGHGPKTPVLELLRPVVFADDQLKHLHGAPFVPNRVWIHSTDEQFPEENGVHTHEARSLLEFVQHWLADSHHQLKVA